MNLYISQAYKFDGIVLEVWSQLGGQAKKALQMLIKTIGTAFKSAKLTFVLVIPPPLTNAGTGGMIDRDDVKEIIPYVDFLSLMTYDYSNPQRPGSFFAFIIYDLQLINEFLIYRGKQPSFLDWEMYYYHFS